VIAAETLHDGIAETRGHVRGELPGDSACVNLRLQGGLATQRLTTALVHQTSVAEATASSSPSETWRYSRHPQLNPQ